jgi:hypothetical protein
MFISNRFEKIENIKFTQNKLLSNLQTIVVDKEMYDSAAFERQNNCTRIKCVVVQV